MTTTIGPGAGACTAPAAALPSDPPDGLTATVAEYGARWLQDIQPLVKPRTHDNYERTLRLHVTPRLGAIPLAALSRSQVRQVLLDALRAGMAPAHVRVMLAVVRAMLSAAVEEEILTANPALGVGRTLKLRRRQGEADEVRAMDAVQLARFLEAARNELLYGAFLTLARTGLRVGEALGLRWDDVNESERWVRVSRTWVDNASWEAGERYLPKSGRTRLVDLSAELTAYLRSARLKASRTSPRCAWVFPNAATGLPWARQHVAKAMKRALTAAGLPTTLTPHALRHTYASLLLSRGEPPQFVQRQLGHASIELTVGTYGRWLPMRRLDAVDALDASTVGACLPASREDAAPSATGRRDEDGAMVASRESWPRKAVNGVATTSTGSQTADDVVADVLRAARKAIALPSRWCRYTAALDAFGTPLAVEEHRQAAATCAVGALWTVDASPEERVDAAVYLEGVAEELLLERAPTLPEIGRCLTEVNDRLGHEAVLLVYDRAIDLADAPARRRQGSRAGQARHRRVV